MNYEEASCAIVMQPTAANFSPLCAVVFTTAHKEMLKALYFLGVSNMQMCTAWGPPCGGHSVLCSTLFIIQITTFEGDLNT